MGACLMRTYVDVPAAAFQFLHNFSPRRRWWPVGLLEYSLVKYRYGFSPRARHLTDIVGKFNEGLFQDCLSAPSSRILSE